MHNTLIVDSREAVLKESGDVILSKAPLFAEAGEVFAGTRRRSRSATTVFKVKLLLIEPRGVLNTGPQGRRSHGAK